MSKIDVSKLDDSKKLAILKKKKAVEKEGLSYTAKKIGIDRSGRFRAPLRFLFVSIE
jgi:hypothetical protein